MGYVDTDGKQPHRTVGAVKETAPGERRVALTPETVGRLRDAGLTVLVEAGAGHGAWFPDSAYVEAGAAVVRAAELSARADVLLCVRPPGEERLRRLRPGQALLGMLAPARDPALVRRYAAAGVTAISLDLLPRTLSRAQPMDALTSQANVAGYKAALVAATAFGGYFPMLVTAAGTVRPAQVLVLGAGVAGLQAIGTAHRLGAQVTAYDIRPGTEIEVASVGGRFLDLGGPAGSPAPDSPQPGVADGSAGGYARVLSGAEAHAQQQALIHHLARFDVVIATAQVPHGRPPLLVTEDGLKTMRPGSVVVDLAASPLGGNVEGSRPDATEVIGDGVTVIGAPDLAATVPTAASRAYGRNAAALLVHLLQTGFAPAEPDDEVRAAVVVTHAGSVVQPAIAQLLTTVGGEA